MSNVADSAASSADVSSLNRQHNDDHQTTVKQTKLAERHQLIRAFWSKFVHCNDDKEKVKWLDLFIAEFNHLISYVNAMSPTPSTTATITELSSDECRFLSPAAASQLTCYLLQLVHEIIVSAALDDDSQSSAAAESTSTGDDPTVAPASPTSTKRSSKAGPLSGPNGGRYARGIAMLNADITTIVVLREFLMHGVGGRILEVLLMIDTNNMLCARELTGLLINLFPTSAWETLAPEIAKTTKEIMTDLEQQSFVLERLEAVIRNNQRSHQRKIMRKSNALANPNAVSTHRTHTDDLHAADDDNTMPSNYDPKNHSLPDFPQLTGDYIGSLVLNLILKLVREDVATHAQLSVPNTHLPPPLDAGSVTVQCLNFALETYATMPTSSAFRPANNAILSRRLLVIVCRALIGVFSKPAICDAVCVDGMVDICDVVQRMLAAAERLFDGPSADDVTVGEHRVSVCLALALILQRCVQGGIGGIEELATEMALIDNVDHAAAGPAQRLTDVLTQYNVFIVRMLVHIEHVDAGLGFLKCITHLQNSVRTLRIAAIHQNDQLSPSQLQQGQQRRRSSRPSATRKRSHMSSLNACGPQRQSHNHQHHLHQRTDTLACVLERILLQLAAQATVAAHLRQIYRHFQLNAPCCCNATAAHVLERQLTTARNAGILPFALQYVRNCILRPMYGCGTRLPPALHQQQPQPLRSHIVCESCDIRRIQFVVDGTFVQLYSELATDSSATELPFLLRHLAKVAKYLPFDSACRVLAEVLLPQFRHHKSSATDTAPNVPILSLCLNAFLCYLRDIRLIKAFFNDDNIQHLDDLIVRPPLASLVCCLVRIGVDNASYLGENCGEQQALAERLRRLQVDSVLAVTATLAALFRALGECDVQLARMEFAETGVGRSKHSFMSRLERRELTVTELLQLAVVYWNQLLKSVRRASIANVPSSVPPSGSWAGDSGLGDAVLSALVQNTLSCFLYSRPIFIDVYDRDGCAVNRSAGHDRVPEARFVWVPLDREADELNGMVDADKRPIAQPSWMYCTAMDETEVANTTMTSSFLSSGTPSPGGSASGLIFDLRQTRSEQNHLHTMHQQPPLFGVDSRIASMMYSSYGVGAQASTVDLSRFSTGGANTSADVNANLSEHASDDCGDVVDHCGQPASSVVHNVFQFFSDNVWELLFPVTARQTRAGELLAEQHQLAIVFGSTDERMRIVEQQENKRLFLQLFEIACGVLMCDGVLERQVSAAAEVELGSAVEDCDVDTRRPHHRPAAASMSSESACGEPSHRSRALHHLKAILLRHAEHIHESAQNGAAIVAALQSLLKCAEMRYRCCMVDDCEHASYAQAPGGCGVNDGSGAAEALNAVTTTSSLRSGGTVGDNLCCAASLQTVNFDKCGSGVAGGANAIEQHGMIAAAVDSYSSDADVTDGDEDQDDDDELMNGLVRNAEGGVAVGLRVPDRASSDGSYITADEGYDGDAELAVSLDSDNDASDAPTSGRHHYADASADPNCSSVHVIHGDVGDDYDANVHATSSAPASRYRHPIIHVDICRIVVDILIELAKRCLEEPDFWPVYLLPITQRFIAIRESLGGALLLLRGFAPVLESNDGRLRELQRAILGLVTDVSTPQTLTAYLALLANGEHPPMEILLSRLFNLGGASHRVQPVSELRFPIGSDGSLCEGEPIPNEIETDRTARDAIVDMRHSHYGQGLRTALTRATYLIPIDACGFQPWSAADGFTVAVWLNIRPHAARVSAAASQSSGFGAQSERSETSAKTKSSNDKTHLLSVGSDRLMLSIYLHTHDPATMLFHLTRPEAPGDSERNSRSSTTGRIPRSHTHDGNSDDRMQQHRQQPPPHRHRANSHSAHTDPIGLNVLTSTALAFQTTRIALRNSLSQFNLFVSTSASAAAASNRSAGSAAGDFKSLRYPLEVRGVRLQRSRWTHVAFSVQTIGTELSVRITIDGLDQHDVHLPCTALAGAGKHDQFNVLCVGDSRPVADTMQSTAATAEHVDVDTAYALANVQLFRRRIIAPDILAMLVAVGPDASDFVPCALGNTVPNFGHLNPLRWDDVLQHLSDWDGGAQAMHSLHESLALTFSATNPRFAIGRPLAETAGQRIPVMATASIDGALPAGHTIPSLQTAVVMCGGLSVLCYLYARVVEQCPNDEPLQAATLAFVLRTVHTSTALYTEFYRMDGMRLLSAVIRSERCRRGVTLLGAILDIACDQPVLVRRPAVVDQPLIVCPNTAASVVHADLIVTVLRRYGDWHSAARPNGAVIETLLLVVQALVREKHPRQTGNQRRLRDAGLVPALLHFCKFYLVGVATPVPLSAAAAGALVGLVGTFAGAPPAAALLDDVVKVLLLLHRPSDSFITHDRSKFYFLVTPAAPQRPRGRLSLPHLATTGRRGFGTGFASAGSGHASSSSNTSVVVMRTRKATTPIRLASTKAVPAASTSPTAAAASTSFQTVDLSAIADCSRGASNNGRWLLSESDVVAAGGAAQLQQQQRHQRGGSHRHAIGTIVARRRLLDGSRRRGTSGTAAVARQHLRTRSALALRRSSGRSGRHCAATGGGSSSDTNVSESGFDENISGLVNQYDIIATEDIAAYAELTPTPTPPTQRRPASFTSSQSSHSSQSRQPTPSAAHCAATAHGVRAIQTGLFGLLTDFILVLPDSTIRDVLTHYVTVDVVLVLANHRDTAVRASIVRLLAAICQRLGEAALAQCQRAHSWLHCGNQVALHPVDEALVLACCRWVTGAGPGVQSIDQIAGGGRVRIADRVGLHALLAVLPQTVADERLLRPCVQLVERLYADAEPEQRQYMVEQGVVASLVKCMQQYVQRSGATEGEPDETAGHKQQQQREFVDAVLVSCAQTIGSLAMRGNGSITVLWDLLNVLTFFEDTRNATVVTGVRRYQADVLHHLVAAFLPALRLTGGCDSRFSVSEITLNTTNLSTSEIRTRFELLIDRTVQFITTVEPTHQLTAAELRLTQFLIQLAVAGLQRSATLVTWSLCPARPLPLKMHTVHTLHQYIRHSSTANLSACTDPKLLRCMLAALMATDYEVCAPADQERMRQLATSVGLPRPNVVTHLSHTLDRLESVRQSALRDQRPAIERTVHRPEPIVQPCIDAAMRCTRAVVEQQNAERRQLINAMRAGDDELRLAGDWRRLVERMTHEAAPWHAARVYPRSWQLDETEGPGRARTRLRRCHLSVANRFLMAGEAHDESAGSPQSAESTTTMTTTTTQPPPPEPLHYLRESLVQRPHFPLNDRVLYTFACCHLPVDCEHEGELIVTESHLIFVPNAVDREPVRLSCADITEIWPRRHQHRNVGLEFYQAERRSVLFVFGGGETAADVCAEREQLVRFFADKVVQPGAADDAKLVALTKHWSEGDLTNWEYLMQLNQISGRTFQDLMQYPVLPWILADYTSAVLDLNDAAAFRRLDRPIAVQSEASETHYIANYTYLQQAQQEMARSHAALVAATTAAAATASSSSLSLSAAAGGSANGGSPTSDTMAAGSHMQPYHYGSHYSNSGTVLHYLVRVPPFTNFFLRYQDNSFDLPDRTFHSMHTTWRLASRDSPTDVKELIPEFFTLPEMLENFESFRFGQRQSGERVDNVALPPWSGQSARLFVLIHRQALESDAVRVQLHRWVDLVFGWRQTGAAAVQAINVFHPATYIGFSAANGTDPVERKAFETMVRTYGQMPRQLFHHPHAAAIVPVAPETQSSTASVPTTDPAAILPVRVRGLRWGRFTGSPQLAEPIVAKHFNTSNAAAMLIALPHTNVCYALPAGCNLMQGPEPDTMNVVAWREGDGIVRVRRLKIDDGSGNGRRDSDCPDARPLCAVSAADPITACGSNAAATQLWFGHRSGRLVVHRYAGTADRQQQRLNKTRYVQHSAPFTLASYNSAFRHRTGAESGSGLKSTVAAGNADRADAWTAHSPYNGTSRGWLEPIVLVRHTDQVTDIALSDEFRVCVSVGRDGAACIWDANSLVYVRCIEPPSICRPGTPIRLVAVSPTMGDIVTVHALDDRNGGRRSDLRRCGDVDVLADVQADVGLEAIEATEEEGEEDLVTSASAAADAAGPADRDANAADFVSVRPQNVAGGRSVMRVHTINARYVGHVVDAERIECIAYSAVREGTGINVIAAGYADGTVRLWSSWDLTLVRVLPAMQLPASEPMAMVPRPVASVAFSTYQHLVVLTSDGAIRVWQSDRLAGPSPKFPRVVGTGGGAV